MGSSRRATDICVAVRLGGGSVLLNARTGAEERTDDLDVSPVTRHRRGQNRISRWLRDEYKKTRYLAVSDTSTSNSTISRLLRYKYNE